MEAAAAGAAAAAAAGSGAVRSAPGPRQSALGSELAGLYRVDTCYKTTIDRLNRVTNENTARAPMSSWRRQR